MARNKPRKTVKTVSVLLEPELLERLDALAEERSRSRTAQLRVMLLRELKRLSRTSSQAPQTENAPAA